MRGGGDVVDVLDHRHRRGGAGEVAEQRAVPRRAQHQRAERVAERRPGVVTRERIRGRVLQREVDVICERRRGVAGAGAVERGGEAGRMVLRHGGMEPHTP